MQVDGEFCEGSPLEPGTPHEVTIYSSAASGLNACTASCQSMQPAQNMSSRDIDKAMDAILVAIGIVAVLIANVTYLGYLAPPGGADAYWLDCNYSVFVVFIYTNGFALVFSIAAIGVVTFGPLILVRQNQRVLWRWEVVSVGLFHLTFSLVALVAALACAGYIVAGFRAPRIDCGKLTCEEGGLKCNLINSIPHEQIAGGFGLDANLRTLNQDVLFNGDTSASISSNLTCCDFNYVTFGSQSNLAASAAVPSAFKSNYSLASTDYVLKYADNKDFTPEDWELYRLYLESSFQPRFNGSHTTWCINQAVDCAKELDSCKIAYNLLSIANPHLSTSNLSLLDAEAEFGVGDELGVLGPEDCSSLPELAIDRKLTVQFKTGEAQDFYAVLPQPPLNVVVTAGYHVLQLKELIMRCRYILQA